MPANYADQPTSNWDFSHALAAGDEVVSQWDERFEITSVRDDGAVNVRRLDTDEQQRETWSEEATRSSLAHGEVELADDGRDKELATY